MTVSLTLRAQLRPIARGKLDRARIDDIGYMLAALVDAYSTTIERNPAIDRRRLATILLFMRHGVDPVDDDRVPINEIGHLTGAIRRTRHGSMSWLGHVSIASLSRVLEGRLRWVVPGGADDQQLIDAFASASLVDREGSTIDDVFWWAFDRNTVGGYTSGETWGIEGLSMAQRPAREVSIGRVRPTTYSVDFPDPAASVPVNPLDEFVGVYDRARADAHRMIFGGEHDPRIVPMFPGLLLCAALTIEYVTGDERPHDLFPADLVDKSKKVAWNRVGVPAAQMMDPEMTTDAAAQTCLRAAKYFGWLVDLASDHGDTTDHVEGP